MKSFAELEDAFYQDVYKELLAGLAQCTAEQNLLFKRMYANGHLNWPIERVVRGMKRNKLDWAMQQVQRTLGGNDGAFV